MVTFSRTFTTVMPLCYVTGKAFFEAFWYVLNALKFSIVSFEYSKCAI